MLSYDLYAKKSPWQPLDVKWFDWVKTLKIRRKKVPEHRSSAFNDKKALCIVL
jgi:hypothetical protein